MDTVKLESADESAQRVENAITREGTLKFREFQIIQNTRKFLKLGYDIPNDAFDDAIRIMLDSLNAPDDEDEMARAEALWLMDVLVRRGKCKMSITRPTAE